MVGPPSCRHVRPPRDPTVLRGAAILLATLLVQRISSALVERGILCRVRHKPGPTVQKVVLEPVASHAQLDSSAG